MIGGEFEDYLRTLCGKPAALSEVWAATAPAAEVFERLLEKSGDVGRGVGRAGKHNAKLIAFIGEKRDCPRARANLQCEHLQFLDAAVSERPDGKAFAHWKLRRFVIHEPGLQIVHPLACLLMLVPEGANRSRGI